MATSKGNEIIIVCTWQRECIKIRCEKEQEAGLGNVGVGVEEYELRERGAGAYSDALLFGREWDSWWHFGPYVMKGDGTGWRRRIVRKDN